jgi:hypothetical protein
MIHLTRITRIMPMSERPSQPGLVWVLGVSGASRG